MPKESCLLIEQHWPAEQAAAVELEMPSPTDFVTAFTKGQLQRLLVLDGLQDPGNMVGDSAVSC